MNSIFAKASINVNKSNEKPKLVLYNEHIIKSIPSEHHKQPQHNLAKFMTEWRWRMYKINQRTFTEISKKEPINNRIFIDNTGSWIQFELDPQFEQFITDQFYFYSN
jgi:hypothetical protein